MESRIDILNELKELSPLLDGMEKLHVFTVPEGYFEGLSARILGIVKEEETGVLSKLSKQQSFEVPAGYFDNLSNTILARIKAQQNETAADELRVLSPMLYSIQNENVFEVPAGYFDSLSSTVMTSINGGQNETAADELRVLSPMLYSIQNENVFEVPNGYFADLSDEILNTIHQPQTKLVVMRMRSSSFIKYAVAAAFTGMMALGVFKFTAVNKNDNADPAIKIGQDIAKENKFDEEMAKVTDADIVKYLEANGSDVKTALVANSVNENELPSQEDYLMDDKALDKYLDNINVNDLKN